MLVVRVRRATDDAMSGGYASRLSHYPHKGVCGLPETIDSSRILKNKMNKLHKLVLESPSIAVLTGAGISTSAGIPDFRGPNGIWTIEEREKKKKKNDKDKKKTTTNKRKRDAPPPSPPNDDDESETPEKKRRGDGDGDGDVVVAPAPSDADVGSFEGARPTLTHVALAELASLGRVGHVVTQNVDGLHRRSGLDRTRLSVLHGCVFTETCERCGVEYFRDRDLRGLSRRRTGNVCAAPACDGHLRDTVLDWDDELPERDFAEARLRCRLADLVLCLGTSLRIEPAGSLPLLAERYVIVNMQRTPYDDRAALVIRAKVDDVMHDLMTKLGVRGWDALVKEKNFKVRPL